MKLIFLLLFIIAPLHLCSTNYVVSGELVRSSYVVFYPSTSGQYCSFFVRIDDIPIGSDLYFKISISSGSFENGNMHYAPSLDFYPVGQLINLPNTMSYEYYNSSTKAYYYMIKKHDYFNYFYISSPTPTKYDKNSFVTIVCNFSPIYFFLGDLSKFSYKTFKPSEKGKYGVFCIKPSDFPRENEINFQTTITSGTFAYGYMYYSGFDSKLSDGQEVLLTNRVPSINGNYYSIPIIYNYSL